jgi:predicted DNA binding protein
VELWEAPVAASAHRHGFVVEDIRHALRNLVAVAADHPRDDCPYQPIQIIEGVTMARTILDKERAAAEIAARLAKQDEDPAWRDAEPLRRIAHAFQRSATADTDLAEAVRAARADGYSWASIAAMLGVSKQTAQARYGA